ncbi:MAG: hypothetical protein H6Q35_1959 [Proteobacteria bacterium]|nr:hypothetical protein [Pseudomonadota bacterium]
MKHYQERNLDLEEFVDEIYEDTQSNHDSKYIFFLGAGCSVSSGIKLAGDLAKEWYENLEKQNSKFKRFNEEHTIDASQKDSIDFGKYYFEIFETLFPTPLTQQKEIQRITEGKTPCLGYYVLSALMQKSQFNTVITTNFDNLIQDALIYSGNKRALVITHQDLAKFIERNDTPLITKIHGDAHLHPFNNATTTKEIPEDLRIAIQGLFINAKVIFIGYKGNDESIAHLLNGCKRIDQVYWLGTHTPTNSKLKDWWSHLTTKTHVSERDFDKIMSLIKDKFKLEKPNFEKRFQELESRYNEAEKQEIDQMQAIENKTFIDYFLMGNTYASQKEYEQAIDAYKQASLLNPKDDATLINWGSTLYDLSKISEHDKAEALLIEAFEKYKQASLLNPKDDVTLMNWGNALATLAKISKPNRAETLFIEAFEKYKQASLLNPKDDVTLMNWGSALATLAKISKPNRAETLFIEAFEKYKQASLLNPKDDVILINWGSALATLAKISEHDRAETLFTEVFEKYKQASLLNPKNDKIFYNWGNALTDLAEISEHDRAETLFTEAFDKFKQASLLNPKDDKIFYNWGSALTTLAKISEHNRAEALFTEAFDKLNKAIEMGASTYNLACLYAIRGNKDKALEVLEKSFKNKEIKTSFVMDDEDWKHFKEDEDFLKLIQKQTQP